MLNPIALNRLCIIYLFCLLITSGCHLPTLDTPECSGPKPDAKFSLSLNNCDQPCPEVKISHTIVAGANYVWKLDGDIFERRPDFKSFNLSTPGPHEIRLVLTSNGGCVDSSSQFVTVSNIVRFKMVLPVSNANTTPLYATQKADGTYHCLYTQGAIMSVTASPQKAISTAFTFSTIATANQVISFNGGFALSRGTTGNQAEIELIPNSNFGSNKRPINFGSSNPSVGQGMTVTGTGQIAFTGSAFVAGKYTPGIAIVNSSNVVQGTPVALNPVVTGLTNHSGLGIVQRPSSSYFLTTFQQDPLGGTAASLLEVNSLGNLIGTVKSLSPLRFANKIIRLSGDFYALIGREGSSMYLIGINSSGNIAWTHPLTGWTSIRDLVFAPDGTIVVCGTKANALQGAKFSYNTSSASIVWDRTYNESTGSSAGVSVVNTSDGGFLFYGAYTNNGLTQPYLIKVDNMGNHQ